MTSSSFSGRSQSPDKGSDQARAPLSIVTVVFNDKEGLSRTAQSLENQSCDNFEWIVVDGASVDGTSEWLKENFNRRGRWVSEPDSGIYDAMNKGIELSNGQYILFLNAGDLLADDAVVEQLQISIDDLGSRSDLICGTSIWSFKSGLNVVRQTNPLEQSIWHRMPSVHQSLLFSKEFIDRHPYDTSYKLSGDYAIIATWYKNDARATYIDRPICRFMAGGASQQNWHALLSEAVRIQITILKLPIWLIGVSFLRRVIWLIGMRAAQWVPFRGSI